MGSKPIEGVGTAVAAFVGVAPGGPAGRPLRISSWTQFARVYTDPQQPDNGPFVPDAYLAHAIQGFFANGGRVCWTVRAGRQQSAVQEALASLAEVDEITVVSVPDRTPRSRGLEGYVIGHCEAAGNRMAILDPPPGLEPRDVLDWRTGIRGRDSEAATLYWPWIEVADPLTDRPLFVPPSGHVAGVWARTDHAHGIHRAPTDGAVLGATGLAYAIRKDEQGKLGPVGHQLHPLLRRGRGIRVWGARTLAERPRVALSERPPALPLDRGLDRRGDPLDRVRAARPPAWKIDPARRQVS